MERWELGKILLWVPINLKVLILRFTISWQFSIPQSPTDTCKKLPQSRWGMALGFHNMEYWSITVLRTFIRLLTNHLFYFNIFLPFRHLYWYCKIIRYIAVVLHSVILGTNSYWTWVLILHPSHPLSRFSLSICLSWQCCCQVAISLDEASMFNSLLDSLPTHSHIFDG